MRSEGVDVRSEWEIGWGSASDSHPSLFYALVDLREFEALPDIYFVPSRVIAAYFKGGDPKTWIRARYHPRLAKIEMYKDGWRLLARALKHRRS